MKATLVVIKGKPEGMEIPLKQGNFVIGRDKSCNLRPNNDLVSKTHCRFQLTESGVTLEDLGSTNGTMVNSNHIRSKVALSDGDEVTVGALTFRVSLVMDATKPAKKPAPSPAHQETVAKAAETVINVSSKQSQAKTDDDNDDMMQWLVSTSEDEANREPSESSTVMDMRIPELAGPRETVTDAKATARETMTDAKAARGKKSEPKAPAPEPEPEPGVQTTGAASPEPPKKKDTHQAAQEILERMRVRKRS